MLRVGVVTGLIGYLPRVNHGVVARLGERSLSERSFRTWGVLGKCCSVNFRALGTHPKNELSNTGSPFKV